MTEIDKIIESGSFTSKERLTETINALSQRAKLCRHKMVNGLMTVSSAASEIYACNNWIECFTEMKNSL